MFVYNSLNCFSISKKKYVYNKNNIQDCFAKKWRLGFVEYFSRDQDKEEKNTLK